MKFRLNYCWPSRAPGGGMCRCCSWPSWPPTESSWCRPPARTSWLASGKESQQLVWIIWGLWFGLGGNLSISSISKIASEFCHSKVVSLSCSFWNLLVYRTSGFHPGGGVFLPNFGSVSTVSEYSVEILRSPLMISPSLFWKSLELIAPCRLFQTC